MKKKILYLFVCIILIIILFLNFKGSRYTGINYSIKEEKISNFKKIKEFYIRYYNYKKLVKKITVDIKNEDEKIIKISKWVYLNIKKKTKDDLVIDSHPWTIVERKIGVKDQFSDILSVLLVVNDTDAFFMSKIDTIGPLTFFKHEQKWSIIDPYYGIYFLNNKKNFCSLNEHKENKCTLFHLKYGEISNNEITDIFFDKNFKNYEDLKNYYNFSLNEIPTENDIENMNIYLRGGRSYIQRPINRFIYQIQKYLNLI